MWYITVWCVIGNYVIGTPGIFQIIKIKVNCDHIVMPVLSQSEYLADNCVGSVVCIWEFFKSATPGDP